MSSSWFVQSINSCSAYSWQAFDVFFLDSRQFLVSDCVWLSCAWVHLSTVGCYPMVLTDPHSLFCVPPLSLPLGASLASMTRPCALFSVPASSPPLPVQCDATLNSRLPLPLFAPSASTLRPSTLLSASDSCPLFPALFAATPMSSSTSTLVSFVDTDSGASDVKYCKPCSCQDTNGRVKCHWLAAVGLSSSVSSCLSKSMQLQTTGCVAGPFVHVAAAISLREGYLTCLNIGNHVDWWNKSPSVFKSHQWEERRRSAVPCRGQSDRTVLYRPRKAPCKSCICVVIVDQEHAPPSNVLQPIRFEKRRERCNAFLVSNHEKKCSMLKAITVPHDCQEDNRTTVTRAVRLSETMSRRTSYNLVRPAVGKEPDYDHLLQGIRDQPSQDGIKQKLFVGCVHRRHQQRITFAHCGSLCRRLPRKGVLHFFETKKIRENAEYRAS